MDEVRHHNNQSHPGVQLAGLWRTLIEMRTGMVLPERQHSLFEQRILSLMSKRRLSEESYYQLVCQNKLEWQCLAEALMVHETSFFRHAPSFDLVEQYLLNSNKPVKLWSAGCSTGEEAWSLAMMADRFSLYGYEVLATDISHQALMQAKQGIYPLRKSLQVPARFRDSYGSALNDNQWAVDDKLRAHVFFRAYNLIDVLGVPFRKLDIIFCHNVLIYFKKFERRDILNALVQCLGNGGMLVLGPGEVLEWKHPQLQKIEKPGVLAYEKVYN